MNEKIAYNLDLINISDIVRSKSGNALETRTSIIELNLEKVDFFVQEMK